MLRFAGRLKDQGRMPWYRDDDGIRQAPGPDGTQHH